MVLGWCRMPKNPSAVAPVLPPAAHAVSYRGSHFVTREQARRTVAGWIDEYNTVRRYSTDQMLAPVDYERIQAHNRRAAA
jgi:hypothetical protein